jgi:uncharacterized Ntn-hydrolase superfamily protein
MTFSIGAICERTGRIGHAVTTSSVCVGARVGRIGHDCVVFSQARTDPRLHTPGLEAFARTGNVDIALQAMKDAASSPHWRQLGILARGGDAAHFTGESCLPSCGGLVGAGCLALGNFLGSDRVLPAMVDAAADDGAPLAERLIRALQAGLAAGGENDPLQSASLQVLGEDGLFEADLRVDKSVVPLDHLAELWSDWAPKAAAYRTRALTPDAAPPSSEVEHGHG